jgi:hypothetical protein
MHIGAIQISILLLALIPNLGFANLDDTMQESALKYEPPTATGSPQILVYTHPPFRIWQTYDDTGSLRDRRLSTVVFARNPWLNLLESQGLRYIVVAKLNIKIQKIIKKDIQQDHF